MEMNQDPHLRVCNTIARHAMIRPGDRVGLGVSGGADSMAMLRIFADLQTKLGITIFVLHFHHQLRGTAADEDERFVKALAEEFHLEFESDRADVAGEDGHRLFHVRRLSGDPSRHKKQNKKSNKGRSRP